MTLPDSLGAELSGVTALVDFNRDSLNGKFIKYTTTEGEPDPDSVATELFGIARTVVGDLPEESSLEGKAEIEDDYTEFTIPPYEERDASTVKIDKFRIGKPDSGFVIALDQPVSPGMTFSGKGTFDLGDGVDALLLQRLAGLELTLTDITLGEGDDIPVATAGTVSWESDMGLSMSIFGFDLKVKSLGIQAQMGATIAGEVKIPSKDKQIPFSVELDKNGNFFGDIKAMPELEYAGFTLEESMRVIIDFHSTKSPPPQPSSFMGLFIDNANVALPEQLAKGGQRPKLFAEKLSIGNNGFSGKVGMENNLLQAGLAGFKFGLSEISVTFDRNEITAGSLTGNVEMPRNLSGRLEVGLDIGSEEWSATINTDPEKPIAWPKLGFVIALKDGSGITYRKSDEYLCFTLNATLKSENFGDFDVQGLKIDSEPSISLESAEYRVDRDISFGSGFNLSLETVSLTKDGDTYWVGMTGGFGFTEMIQIRDASIKVREGPSVSVDSISVDIEHGPFSLSGKVVFMDDFFKGEFGAEIKNVFRGIDGMFVVGTGKDSPDGEYTYWYMELEVGARIPLGQTGLSILKFGGGVGWNYDPPVGIQEGGNRKTDSHSLKASITVGNTPQGKVFAGKLTLVLVSDRFTLNGRVWVLNSPENMYGEGQLNLRWGDPKQLDGYVRMFLGIPDSKGEIVYFEGQVDFKYAGSSDWYVKSKTINGSLLKSINARASIDLTRDRSHFDGRIWYSTTVKQSLVVATLKVYVSLAAGADLTINHPNAEGFSINANADIAGVWDVDLGSWDVAGGGMEADVHFEAPPPKMKAILTVSWDFWFDTDSTTVTIGYGY